MRTVPALASVTLAALLAACGGGGGNGGSPSPSPAADAAAREALVQGLACQGPAQTGWCWQRPLPWGNAVNAVRFIDPLHGLAVGEAGLVLRTTDGGAHWARVRQASHFESSLHTLQVTDADHAWALGWDGAPLRTVDGGQSWSKLDAGLRPGSWTDVWTLDRQRVVVSGSPFGASRSTRVSTDGGATWRDSAVAAQWVTPSGVMWGYGSDGQRRSTDLGLTAVRPEGDDQFEFFQPLGGDRMMRFRQSDAMTAAGQPAPQVQMSRDGGLTWTLTPLQSIGGDSIFPYLLTAQGRGWGTLKRGVGTPLFRTEDDGLSWTALTLPAGIAAADFLIQDAPDIDTVFGNVGRAHYCTGDAGQTWRQLRVDGKDAQPKLDGSGAPGALVLEVGDQKFHSRDGGATATLIPGGSRFTADLVDLIGLRFFDLQRGIAVTTRDTLLDTRDGGRTWTHRVMDSARCDVDGLVQVNDGPAGVLGHCRGADTGSGAVAEWAPLASAPPNLSQVMLAGTDELWASSQQGERVGGGRDDPLACVGQLHRSTDAGRHWTVVSTRFGTQCLTLGLAPGGPLFAIARDEAGLWRSIDGGATWALSTTPGTAPSTASRMFFLDASRGWLVEDQRLLATRDGGLSWQASRLPSLPITQLRTIRFVSAQHGWALGDNGVVLSSIDGGDSWTLQDSGSAANLAAVFALDADTVWVAGAYGTILVSRNGGR